MKKIILLLICSLITFCIPVQAGTTIEETENQEKADVDVIASFDFEYDENNTVKCDIFSENGSDGMKAIVSISCEEGKEPFANMCLVGFMGELMQFSSDFLISVEVGDESTYALVSGGKLLKEVEPLEEAEDNVDSLEEQVEKSIECSDKFEVLLIEHELKEPESETESEN